MRLAPLLLACLLLACESQPHHQAPDARMVEAVRAAIHDARRELGMPEPVGPAARGLEMDVALTVAHARDAAVACARIGRDELPDELLRGVAGVVLDELGRATGAQPGAARLLRHLVAPERTTLDRGGRWAALGLARGLAIEHRLELPRVDAEILGLVDDDEPVSDRAARAR